MEQGKLVYEYNMMIIEQYAATSAAPLEAGKHRIEVATRIAGPGKAGTVMVSVDGTQVARTDLKRTVPDAFSATETFDVGVDLGSPVSVNYFELRPFTFDGAIHSVHIELR